MQHIWTLNFAQRLTQFYLEFRHVKFVKLLSCMTKPRCECQKFQTYFESIWTFDFSALSTQRNLGQVFRISWAQIKVSIPIDIWRKIPWPQVWNVTQCIALSLTLTKHHRIKYTSILWIFLCQWMIWNLRRMDDNREHCHDNGR